MKTAPPLALLAVLIAATGCGKPGGNAASGIPSETVIPWALARPVIDGEFTGEAAWQGAVVLAPFRGTMDGAAAHSPTEVRLMWDAEHLYVAMSATDDHLMSRFTEHDDELWHEDAFEIFLDPGGNQKDYFEIQVSPAGVVFDSHLPEYRKNQNDWTSHARVAVALDGTLNRPGDVDRGWRAELAILFSSMDRGGGSQPAPGDVWKANFFRVDLTTRGRRYSAWSPPMRGDFHALDRFGQVRFGAPPASERDR